MTVVGLARIARLRRARKETRMLRSRRRQRRFALVATAALAIAGLFGAAGRGGPTARAGEIHRRDPVPEVPAQHTDYVVRCNNGPVTVQGHAAGALGGGDRPESLPQGRLQRGGAAEVGTGFHDQGARRSTHAALSLPRALPAQRLPRIYLHPLRRPVFPKYFSVDPRGSRYAIIFDRHGVPVWWYHGHAYATRVLPNGNVLWSTLGTGGPTASMGASSATSMALASGPTPTTSS